MVARFERLRNPERIKDEAPWVWRSGQELVYRQDGERKVLAEVEESGVGTADAIGRYRNEPTPAELEAAGIIMPPIHGLCRSTILPVLD